VEFVERDPNVPGYFRFRHALIRDGAYEGLSYKRRRELHGRVGEVMELRAGDRADESAELLSLHFHRAERWRETWRYSVAAAYRAEEKYANVETVQFLERALDGAKQWPEVPAKEVAKVWEFLGDVRMRIAAYEAAGAAYREARTFWRGDAVEESRLMQQEAIVPLRLGKYPQALRRLTQALSVLEGLDGEAAAAQRARLYGWYATVLQHQWRPGEAVEWCNRAIAEAETGGAEEALAQAYFILDWGLLHLGRSEEAVHAALAVEIYERLGNLDRLAHAVNIMGIRAYLAGRWSEAVELIERARSTFLKIGDEMNASVAVFNLGMVRADQGRMEEAEALLRDVLQLRRAAANPLKTAYAANELGRFLARTGGFEEARSLLDEARTVLEAEGDEVELLSAHVWLVESHVFEGTSDTALELTEEALKQTQTVPGVLVLAAMLHRHRGWALLQKGELEHAREALEESLRLARIEGENLGMRNGDYEIALALDGLAALGELTGETVVELATERDSILERLAVVDVKRPPLPA
jgi:tetratricopeptide (TPR) repeat protein